MLIPFFTDWGGITLSQVMWLQSWFMIWIVMLEVPTGVFADRHGRRASLLCATLFLISAVAYYATHRGLAHFIVAEFLWACAAAFSSGADEAMIYDSLKAAGETGSSKTALAKLGTVYITAIAVAAPIGSLAAARWGLAAPIQLMLIPFILALPVAWSLREPPREHEERRGYWETLTRGGKYFLGHRILRALAFDSVTVWCFSFMIIWLYQPRLKELGMPLVFFGFVTAGMTLFQAVLLMRIADVERLCGGPRRFLLVSSVIPGLGYLALAAAPALWLAAPLFILIAAFGLSRSTILNNYMHKHIDGSRRATVMSSVGMTRQLLMATAYPLVGWAAQRSLSWTFAGLGAAILASAAASSIEEAHLLER
ncbi:MAG: hypothetical protein A2V88_16635 [Elusimicrobia bacterium RBG_16_66_12]|nr:MAG: hypothetical protein A2V88_16635 [Elusimicrobia bacterium RBG_16_66_12]